MALLISITLLIILVWSRIHYGHLLNPVSVFVGPNALSALLLTGVNWINNSITVQTAVIVGFGVGAYIVGAIIASYIKLNSEARAKKTIEVSGQSLRNASIAMAVVFNLFALLYLAQMQNEFGLATFFDDLSDVNVAQQNGGIPGLYSYFLPIAFPLSACLIALLTQERGVSGKFGHFACVLQLLFCLIPYLFSARRSMLFTIIVFDLLLVLFDSYDGARRRETELTVNSLIKPIGIAAVIVVGMLFMSSTQQLMNKSIAGNDCLLFGIPIPSLMVDSTSYIAGNLSYMQSSNDFDQLLMYVSLPLSATFRMAYLYILPLFGINCDAVSQFATPLINIGINGHYIPYNTEPVFYYAIVDAGLAYPFVLFTLGAIAQKAYEAIMRGPDTGTMSLCVMFLCIMFWSFRSYDLIYLSTWLAFLFSWLLRIRFRRLSEKCR